MNVVEAVVRAKLDDQMSGPVGQLRSRVDDTFGAMNAGAERHLRMFDRVAQQYSRAARAARDFFAPVSAAVVAMVAYLGSLAASTEDATVTFARFVGEGAATQRFLTDLANFAARTPFEMTALRENAVMLMNFKFAASDVIPALRGIGDAVAGLPGAQERVQRIVIALGQMRVKEKATAEEMMQIAEAGVPAWDILARQLGVDVPAAMKLAERGMIDGRAASIALVQGMSEQFGGKMEALSGTLSGMWSNFKDIAVQTGAEIGAVLTPALKDLLTLGTRILGWAREAAVAFAAMPAPVQQAAIALVAVIAAAGPLALAFSGGLKVISMISAAIGPLTQAFTVLRTVAFAFSTGMTGALVGVEATVAAVASALGPVTIAVAAFAAVAYVVYQNWDRIKGLFSALFADLGAMWDRFTRRIGELIMGSFLGDGVRWLTDAWGRIVPWFSSLWDSIVSLFDSALKRMFTLAASAAEKLGLDKTAASLRAWRDELGKVAAAVPAAVSAPAALSNPGPLLRAPQADPAKAAKHLEQELREAAAMRQRFADDTRDKSARVMAEWMESNRRIEALDLRGAKHAAETKAELRRAAALKFGRELAEIQRAETDREIELETNRARMIESINDDLTSEAAKRHQELVKAIEDRWAADIRGFEAAKARREDEIRHLLAVASAIQRITELERRGKVGGNVAADARGRVPEVADGLRSRLGELQGKARLEPGEVEEVIKLQAALEQLSRVQLPDWKQPLADLFEGAKSLNKISLNPFTQMMGGFRSQTVELAGGAAQAFGQMFADMVAGVDGAGRKFIAAMVGMIGQMIMKMGVFMVQLGTAEIILGSNPFTALWSGGASVGHGVALVAIGAAMAAGGGILQGLSSRIAGTNQGAQGSSFQSQVARPTAPQQVQVQPITVGVPGGPQSRGQVGRQEVTVRIEAEKGFVARAVRQDLERNSPLRFSIAGAAS